MRMPSEKALMMRGVAARGVALLRRAWFNLDLIQVHGLMVSFVLIIMIETEGEKLRKDWRPCPSTLSRGKFLEQESCHHKN